MPEPGELFGIYKILEEMPYRNKYNQKLYKLRCIKCGFEKISVIQKCRTPHICKHIDVTGRRIDFSPKNTEDRVLYRVLSGMKQRCYNPNDKDYKHYGGKGVFICEEWLNDNNEFVQWARSSGYQKGLSIDRIDSNGPYSPDNCRWITVEDNAKYKSSTNLYTVSGLTMTGREWADYLNIGTNRINTYIREYGEKETCKFIAWFLEHPEIKEKVKSRTSYYSLYKEVVS